MSIKAGSIVYLKSGSPAMTVKHKNNSDLWVCSWFVNSEVKEYYFNEEQLTEQNPTPNITYPIA